MLVHVRLAGRVQSHIVESFQKLSQKIAIAVNNEQRRCNYLIEQIRIMQTAHDDYDASLDSLEMSKSKFHTPNPSILGWLM